ncbi:putative membrane protein [Agromyces cerinus]|uniref:alpha/beta hydrolase n=1 Tax=Agromyces cerinus TaxID=33878 RepID=UPI001958F87B|nr:alpha/beta-hydrolase family protein [Agromyces cerinus]MBM7832162.1 putative membrane protein [Agromyces cerinus]
MHARWWRLDPGGALIGLLFAALSMTPSLLPRPALFQGIITAFAFLIGYGIGVFAWWLVRRFVHWRPKPEHRRIAWWVYLGVAVLLAIVLAFASVGWQNEVRRTVEMPEIDGFDALIFVVGFAPVVLIGLALARAERRLGVRMIARFGRGWGVTVATAIVVGSTVAVVAVLMFGIDRLYLANNGPAAPWVTEPMSAFRSAGPDSEVEWDLVGRHGTAFLGGGPKAADIEELTGRPALEPVRVYVGQANAPTVEERAAIAVRELERTGAFDRDVLVVATTTGSGWLEPQAVDAVEYLHGGDTAIVSMQYAYTPSWVSFVFDPDAPVASSVALFDAVKAKWDTLPEAARPQLVVYGLSLGAHGAQESFDDLDDLRANTEGALLVGSPNGSTMWRTLTAERDAGSPQWQPVVDGGREVRWLSVPGDFHALGSDWESPRAAYLQHANDPVTWLGLELLWAEPDWLTPEERADEVSDSMRWIPGVTALQLVIDMFMGESVPASHGHNYGDVVLDGWQAVTGDGELDEAALARIQGVLEGYAEVQPVGSVSE